MDVEPVLYREEALAALGAMADIVVELRAIRSLLQGDDDEEEEDLE